MSFILFKLRSVLDLCSFFKNAAQQFTCQLHKQKKKKKKKKEEAESDPIMATNSEVEETKKQQEKCQWVRKWKRELNELQEYWEICNIFLNASLAWNGASHTEYLESRISDAGRGFFFIWSFDDWRMDLQRQSQGIMHSATTTLRRLQTLG